MGHKFEDQTMRPKAPPDARDNSVNTATATATATTIVDVRI
jgi:hypothetical protein